MATYVPSNMAYPVQSHTTLTPIGTMQRSQSFNLGGWPQGQVGTFTGPATFAGPATFTGPATVSVPVVGGRSLNLPATAATGNFPGATQTSMMPQQPSFGHWSAYAPHGGRWVQSTSQLVNPRQARERRAASQRAARRAAGNKNVRAAGVGGAGYGAGKLFDPIEASMDYVSGLHENIGNLAEEAGADALVGAVGEAALEGGLGGIGGGGGGKLGAVRLGVKFGNMISGMLGWPSLPGLEDL